MKTIEQLAREAAERICNRCGANWFQRQAVEVIAETFREEWSRIEQERDEARSGLFRAARAMGIDVPGTVYPCVLAAECEQKAAQARELVAELLQDCELHNSDYQYVTSRELIDRANEFLKGRQ